MGTFTKNGVVSPSLGASIVLSFLIACICSVVGAPAEGVKAASANSEALAGPACAQQPWPYYESHCIRDGRPSVRIVHANRTSNVPPRSAR
jgi:hypothetical protein